MVVFSSCGLGCGCISVPQMRLKAKQKQPNNSQSAFEEGEMVIIYVYIYSYSLKIAKPAKLLYTDKQLVSTKKAFEEAKHFLKQSTNKTTAVQGEDFP